MEIAKELKKTRFSRHGEKTFQQDCGTQVQHPPPPSPPQGGGMQALAISQIQGLFSLPSKSTFYTCCHIGTLDPMEATCRQTNNRGPEVFGRVRVCLRAGSGDAFVVR